MDRSILRLFLALLLFAAHLHCVTGHGNFTRVQQDSVSRKSDSQSLPLSLPVSGSCEHAGGCICEGATLAIPFAIAEIDFSVFFFNDLSAVVELNVLIPPSLVGAKTTPGCWRALPVRALDRCALQQSFLI